MASAASWRNNLVFGGHSSISFSRAVSNGRTASAKDYTYLVFEKRILGVRLVLQHVLTGLDQRPRPPTFRTWNSARLLRRTHCSMDPAGIFGVVDWCFGPARSSVQRSLLGMVIPSRGKSQFLCDWSGSGLQSMSATSSFHVWAHVTGIPWVLFADVEWIFFYGASIFPQILSSLLFLDRQVSQSERND